MNRWNNGASVSVFSLSGPGWPAARQEDICMGESGRYESTMLGLCSAHTVVGMRHKECGVEIVLLLLLLWLIMFRVYLRG